MPPIVVIHAGHRRSKNGHFRAARGSLRLALSGLPGTDSLAQIEGPVARDISSIFWVEPRHIRQGCLACQAEDGLS